MDASPTDIREHLLREMNLDMSANMISSYKSSIRKKAGLKGRRRKKNHRAPVEAVAAAPRHRAGRGRDQPQGPALRSRKCSAASAPAASAKWSSSSAREHSVGAENPLPWFQGRGGAGRARRSIPARRCRLEALAAGAETEITARAAECVPQGNEPSRAKRTLRRLSSSPEPSGGRSSAGGRRAGCILHPSASGDQRWDCTKV